VSNIYLVGFMGAGKTATGKVVARRMKRSFVDLDGAVEARLQLSIREIFETLGEGAFRAAETAELEQAALSGDLVVATGGGAFSNPENRRLIRESGAISIFLDPPWEAIRSRLDDSDRSRPNWIDDRHARALYVKRRPDYLLAEIHLELSGAESPVDVADLARSALAEMQCAS
jgi:shikimate kinase